jgi:hypothetical protein
MKGNGLKENDRVMVIKYGQMEVNISENGRIIKLMDKVHYIMLMVTYIKVNG